ncbi:MAG: sulfatase [Acidobacteriota bacterium]|nr:sulfatase [Acidobacteriota bacterium]
MRHLVCSLVVTATIVLSSCGGSPEPVSIRLVDMFEAATVEGSVAIDPVDPTEWRFDGDGTIALPDPAEDNEDAEDDEEEPEDRSATFGWAALNDIEGFDVVDGRLVGTTGELPLLHAVRPDDLLDENDLLHAVEITMQVSAGTAVGVTFNGGRRLNEERVLRSIRNAPEPPLHAELEPGDEFHEYRLENPGRSFSVGGLRNILLQPTDAADATFAIESVRLIMRKEHLRSIASGPGWQGLDEIYRETIVSRAPERVALDLTLPTNPWLELAVGTVEDHPVTFNVAIDAGAGDTPLWRRTVTLPRRWETQRIELAEYAGQQVTLALSLEGDEDGLVGFWGTPVVRSSGARVPPVDDARSEARAALADGGSTTPQGVIVFLGDTLRRDHLDAWGHGRKTAPTLTALAAEGVRFADAISPATWTKVAVPSLLSSVYPASHGIVGMADRLSSSATTMAEAFRGAGYATFATSSVSFTGKLSNVHQGVEVLHERASIDNGSLGHSSAKTARTYVDRFLTWLDDHHDVPFFAFIHVFDPHDPFEPYPPYDLMWASPTGKEEHEARLEQVGEALGDDRRVGDGNRFGPERFPNREELEAAGVDPDVYAAHQLDWYDGSIRGMDAEIARLMEGLEQRGVAGDTLLAFVSDHGEEFLDHGWGWHGNTVYGEAINVPLMLRWPGVLPAGMVVDATVESLSLMTTLLELSGIPVPETAQGQSLLPMVASPNDPTALGWVERPAFSERKRIASRRERADYDVDQYSVVLDGWKLVRNVDPPEGMPEFELYDHADDPLDHHDVTAHHPDVVERLTAELVGRLRYVEARKLPTDENVSEGLSPAELRRLRSLGYIR